MKKAFKAIVSLVFVTLLLAGWGLAAGAVHVVLSPGELPLVGNITVIPKERMTLHETVVDTRRWSADDLAAHPDLAAHLAETGKAGVLEHVASSSASAATGFDAGLVRTTRE